MFKGRGKFKNVSWVQWRSTKRLEAFSRIEASAVNDKRPKSTISSNSNRAYGIINRTRKKLSPQWRVASLSSAAVTASTHSTMLLFIAAWLHVPVYSVARRSSENGRCKNIRGNVVTFALAQTSGQSKHSTRYIEEFPSESARSIEDGIQSLQHYQCFLVVAFQRLETKEDVAMSTLFSRNLATNRSRPSSSRQVLRLRNKIEFETLNLPRAIIRQASHVTANGDVGTRK